MTPPTLPLPTIPLPTNSARANRPESLGSSMARLWGVSSVVPAHSADNAFAVEFARMCWCDDDKEAAMLSKLYRRTGVDRRGSVLLETDAATDQVSQSFFQHNDETPAGPTTRQRNERFAIDATAMAVRAGREVLQSSGCRPGQVTHVVTVTCTGFNSPGIDVDLIESLKLPATTQRIQVGFMGCHAMINALRTARGLVAADTDACVLIVCVELCSLHYQYGYETQRIVSGSLFADGAAGLIVAGSDFEPIESVHTGREKTTANSENRDEISPVHLVATGSCLIPGSRDAMTWKIGDHGFEMTLSAVVPSLIEANLFEYLSGWLADQGESIASIGGWAVHPGGSRILQAVQTSLELTDEQLSVSRSVLSEHGNMSSATLGAVLARFQADEVPGPWLMLGFGPGLEIEVALLKTSPG